MNSVDLKLVFSVLLLLGASACAEQPGPPPAAPPSGPDLQISDEAQGEEDPPPPPSVPQPTAAPAPPSAPPPPPSEASQSAPPPQPAAAAPAPPPPPAAQPVVQAEPGGQWTYTSQYGWIWLPYAQQYTYVSGDGAAAYEYAYYPNGGWRWVYAPWVLGWGPSPYWGHYGPHRYVWYSHPWFRVGVVHRGPVYHRRWRRY